MNDLYVAVEGIRALDFNDESVVFNPLSWDAHLLNRAAVSVLELLGSAAQSEQEIEAYLRDVLIEAETAAAGQHARRLLDELVQLGLAQRISELGVDALRADLAAEGLSIDLGAARVRIRSDVQELAGLLKIVYGSFTLETSGGVCDVTATLRRKRGLRRFVRPQLEILIDGAVDFQPFPADTLLPLLEWGMNYALAQRASWCLLLHAGVVERHGRAILLPAMPGAGKSTLTAALASRGFRLLSDEFGVVGFDDSCMTPLLRPIALKNQSIEVIAQFAPDAVLGPRYPKTHKGTVAHLAPAIPHVAARHVKAAPGLVIFPRYVAAAGVEVESITRARAFARLAVNSFNYEFLGAHGFDALGRLIAGSDAYHLRYGDLEGAIAAIVALIDALPPAADS